MIDSAVITLKSGNGGDGLISFRREKFVRNGGPWGGDGAKGGDIYLEATDHINTLQDFRVKRHFIADNGNPGMKKLMKGSAGEDLTIKVPIGTMVYDAEGNLKMDLNQNGLRYKAAQGGKGGLGNWNFKSAQNQAPYKATAGEKTSPFELRLELKLLADIGLVGFPNAGKSSLLNVLTDNAFKIGDYKFTTLEPNLAVFNTNKYVNQKEFFVIADIPGLIEGASDGKGLGVNFLKHIERTRILIHMVDGATLLNNDISILLENYKSIRNELTKWNEQLENKPEIIAINKVDLDEVRTAKDEITRLFAGVNKEILFISTSTQEGLKELTHHILTQMSQVNTKNKAEQQAQTESPEIKTYKIDDLPNKRIVFNDNKAEFIVRERKFGKRF
ncbi:MAG: GTPase ObgE [Niabella sp.]|nr:MAG: GTPase ObgE [Niabella sp.]